MTRYEQVRAELRLHPRRWLVTGVAGFIGSNLAETLLRLGQEVVGLDNFSTGDRRNVAELRRIAESPGTGGFRFLEADVRDFEACADACRGVEVVLHQAALGSVPRSIAQPLATHGANADGFLNLLVAAQDAGVTRFVYASSSSVYGDDRGLPKVEARTGRPLSPYAVSKAVGELYAGVYHRLHGMGTVGLRYFNVFGRRQTPDGPYAAVIPRWIGALLSGEPCTIHGDGGTTRDFCYIENVVQANLLAATATDPEALGEVYNVACGHTTSLNDLFAFIRDGLEALRPGLGTAQPRYAAPRPGDIRDSLADLSKIRARLGYEPTHQVAEGLAEALRWYVEAHEGRSAAIRLVAT